MAFKKIAPIALSALLLGTVAVYADEPATEGTQEQVKLPEFLQQNGQITSVEDFAEGKLYYVKQDENEFHFYVDNKTIVLDNTGNEVDLNVGDTISIYVYGNQPMILIYPPRYTPAVVIVQKEDFGEVKVDNFDKNGLSADGNLKLNVSNSTVIVDKEGNKVATKDLVNYSAVVFYGPTTRSIPPQTAPNKIVVFPKFETGVEQDGTQQILDIVGDDTKEVNGQTMVPLRKVAESLGYEVTATANGAMLRKGAVSYTLTRGEKTYGYNKALGYFEQAPQLLENGKTYVELNFALKLLQ